MKKILLCLTLIIATVAPINLLSQSIPANNLFTIEKISIEGNSKTKSGVILANLPYTIGDTLTEQQIHAGIDQLRKTNFFKAVKTITPNVTHKITIYILIFPRR